MMFQDPINQYELGLRVQQPTEYVVYARSPVYGFPSKWP